MQKFISSVIVVLSITFLGCNSSKAISGLGDQIKPPFKVVKATYSEWLGGQPGVHGISVQIQLDNADIKLDTVYLRNNSTKLKLDKTASNILYVGSFTLPRTTKDLQLDIDPKNEFGNKVPDISQKIPFQLNQDEAVVSYFYNNKTYYYKISGIVEVKKENFKQH